MKSKIKKLAANVNTYFFYFPSECPFNNKFDQPPLPPPLLPPSPFENSGYAPARRCSVKKCPLKLLNKTLQKYLGKSSFLVKLQVLKINSFTCMFQSFCEKFK